MTTFIKQERKKLCVEVGGARQKGKELMSQHEHPRDVTGKEGRQCAIMCPIYSVALWT